MLASFEGPTGGWVGGGWVGVRSGGAEWGGVVEKGEGRAGMTASAPLNPPAN